jgi:hypothetical protein
VGEVVVVRLLDSDGELVVAIGRVWWQVAGGGNGLVAWSWSWCLWQVMVSKSKEEGRNHFFWDLMLVWILSLHDSIMQ